jgi:hypothetical protein
VLRVWTTVKKGAELRGLLRLALASWRFFAALGALLFCALLLRFL